MKQETQTIAIKRRDYQVPTFLVETLDLDFNLQGETVYLTAKSRFIPNPDATDHSYTYLYNDDLIITKLLIDETEIDVSTLSTTDQMVTLPTPSTPFTLTVKTTLHPKANTALSGLYQSNGMYCTQCEAEGFRRITLFPDRPDVLAKYTVRIEGDKEQTPILLSNGNKIEEGSLENGRHYAIWQDPHPKPSYLFALVAGDLACVSDSFTTHSGKDVALKLFVEHGDEDKCEHALTSLKKSMKWDEDTFGLEYDLDIFMIVAVSDFNMGAMENKGLNVFNSSCVLASQQTATDADYQSIEGIVAHEYFHNWTGNRVTCRDWFQLSLKEGLTVFRDQEFSADMNSRNVFRIQDITRLIAAQFPEDAGPLAHPIRPDSYLEINNFYTATVYEKGAEVIRMIHTLLGKENFRKGMDLYFARHDGQAATCEDFVQAMEDASQVDLTQFRNWYRQAGTPKVTASYHYNDASQSLTLTFTQKTPATPGQPTKKPTLIPIRLGLIGKNSKAPLSFTYEGVSAEEHVLHLTEETQSFTLEALTEEPVPSLFRGFSAPIKLTTPLTNADQAFLAQHDTDGYVRFEAIKTIARSEMLAQITQGKDAEPHPSQLYLETLQLILSSSLPHQDPAFTAELLGLPTVAELCQHQDMIDIDSTVHVHQIWKEKVGHALETALKDIFERLTSLLEDQPFSVDAKTIGKRSLKNRALSYLGTASPDLYAEDLKKAYSHANNMTDRLQALSIATDALNVDDRDKMLDDFYQTYKDDSLVLNKWFTLQASQDRPDMQTFIRNLVSHEAYDIKNPNKVRSVIRGFTSLNPKAYHDRSGAGYEFVASHILEIDKINPQNAARLANIFSNWKKFDPLRAELLKAQMDRIVETPSLSKDVYEVISKSLL